MYNDFELWLMHKTQTMTSFLVLGTLLVVGMIGITSSNTHVFAEKYSYYDDDDDADDDD